MAAGPATPTLAPVPRPHRLHHLLDRTFGIPHLTPPAAALFRIAMGSAIAWLIWTSTTSLGYPDGTVVALNPGAGYGAGRWQLAHWIRAHPDQHLLIWQLALAAAGSLTLGLFSRTSAALLWASLFLLVIATLSTSGNHTWGAPLIALLGLLLTPLGDAWSIDALARRARGASPRTGASPAYGFAVWWIGLVLGVAFLAAAYAKLHASGVDWALGGAVRYHFVEDASHAPVPWGLWIAGRQPLAVAFSTAGLLTEACLILVIFCRREIYRVLFGLAYLSIHVGFFLFQGVQWFPWWVMALAFVPWQLLATQLQRLPGTSAAASPPPARRLGIVHAVLVAGLLGQQVYASTEQFEYEPMLSHFPMYSGTFASWDEFFRTRRWHKYQRYRFHVRDATGARVEISPPSEVMSPLDGDRVIDALQASYRGEPVPDRSVAAFTALHDRLRQTYGPGGDRIEVVIDADRVNFDQMRIELVAEDLHAFTLRLSPPALEFVAPEFTALGVQ